MKHKRERVGEKLCKEEVGSSLGRSYEEVEIRRKVLRRGKNLSLIEDICEEKERECSKVTPRKAGVGLKLKGVLDKKMWGWRLTCCESNEKKKALHLLALSGKHKCSD